MSYILEALKKAEAERRGALPPNAAVPTSFYSGTQRTPVWRKAWPWALLSALLVTGGGIAWIATRSDQARPAPANEAPQVIAQAPVSPPVTQPPPPAPAQAQPPTPTPAPAPIPAPVPESPPPAAAPRVTPDNTASDSPKPGARPQREKPARKPAEKKPAAEAEASPQPAARPAPPEPPIGSLRDLPPQVQQEIPPLTIGGYIYSANKADRTVLINKRLLREGDDAAPGLTLERLTPSGMILNYKGYRYRASYR